MVDVDNKGGGPETDEPQPRVVFVGWASEQADVHTRVSRLVEDSGDSSLRFTMLGERGRPFTGTIHRNLESKLHEADLMIGFVDFPNANVSYELGRALGLDMPIGLVVGATGTQSWPTGTQLAEIGIEPGAVDPETLRDVALSNGPWCQVQVHAELGDRFAVLCPEEGSGRWIRSKLKNDPRTSGWIIVDGQGWTIDKPAALLNGVGRVAWVVLPWTSKTRHGRENFANGATAGYLHGRGADLRVFNLRPAEGLADHPTRTVYANDPDTLIDHMVRWANQRVPSPDPPTQDGLPSVEAPSREEPSRSASPDRLEPASESAGSAKWRGRQFVRVVVAVGILVGLSAAGFANSRAKVRPLEPTDAAARCGARNLPALNWSIVTDGVIGGYEDTVTNSSAFCVTERVTFAQWRVVLDERRGDEVDEADGFVAVESVCDVFRFTEGLNRKAGRSPIVDISSCDDGSLRVLRPSDDAGYRPIFSDEWQFAFKTGAIKLPWRLPRVFEELLVQGHNLELALSPSTEGSESGPCFLDIGTRVHGLQRPTAFATGEMKGHGAGIYATSKPPLSNDRETWNFRVALPLKGTTRLCGS